jgi:hypothetical protein
MKFGVQTGTWGEYGGGFKSYLREYEGTGTPDWDVIQDLDVLKEEMGEEWEDEWYDEFYRTTDGKIFYSKSNADAHQATLETPELDEVADKLNEALILAKANLGKSHVFKSIVDSIQHIDGDGGDYLMGKYYDSTC